MNKKIVSFVAACAAAGFALSVAFLFPTFAFAANTYTRTPADAIVAPGPVSFHYDYTNWDSDVLPNFYGNGVDFQYILLQVTDGTNQYSSAVVPCVDPGGADYYCTGTNSTPKSIDFTVALASTTDPAKFSTRLCGSRTPDVDANGYFTGTNSCMTYYEFRTLPISMLSDSFAVGTPPPDITPPTVAIVAPAVGETVSGIVSVSADASDDKAVAGVRFQVDGADLGAEITTAPYTATWNTSSSANGAHTLTAIARDAAGNTAVASTTVIVSNQPPQKYIFSGFLPPVKADGSGVYKQGSTLPVKFQLTGVDSGVNGGVSGGQLVATASATISLARVSGAIVGTQEVALSASAADMANQFRYDTSSGQYLYNLSTKPFTPGTWQLQVRLDDERKYTVNISIR